MFAKFGNDGFYQGEFSYPTGSIKTLCDEVVVGSDGELYVSHDGDSRNFFNGRPLQIGSFYGEYYSSNKLMGLTRGIKSPRFVTVDYYDSGRVMRVSTYQGTYTFDYYSDGRLMRIN